MRLLILTVLLATSGAAFGQTAQLDENYRAAFRPTFVARCSAKASADHPGLNFSSACACAADTLLRTKSVRQLRAGIPKSEKREAVVQCFASSPPTRAS